MTTGRIHNLGRKLTDARERMRDAKRTGDFDGYRYAKAECARLSRILAGGLTR